MSPYGVTGPHWVKISLQRCIQESLAGSTHGVKIVSFLFQVIVTIRVVFLKLGEIDTLKENFCADAFIQARWREPALDGKFDLVRNNGTSRLIQKGQILRELLPQITGPLYSEVT